MTVYRSRSSKRRKDTTDHFLPGGATVLCPQGHTIGFMDWHTRYIRQGKRRIGLEHHVRCQPCKEIHTIRVYNEPGRPSEVERRSD